MDAERRRLSDPTERRALRQSPDLTERDADLLLTFDEDFRSRQYDRSLANVVRQATLSGLTAHAGSIAAGSGARALWERLSSDSDLLLQTARGVILYQPAPAPRTTVTLLMFDPIDSIAIDSGIRFELAEAALRSRDAEARGLAVEFLANNAPERVQPAFDKLIYDENERARGYAWQASYLVDSASTWDCAVQILGDESEDLPARRSALIAAGRLLPTTEVESLLSFFVVHREPSLALDAAWLFEQYHRTPAIATAALDSPHAEIREIAGRLMDPYRGSPAAGGSRPGDPTRGDAYANLLRQLSDDSETDQGSSA